MTTAFLGFAGMVLTSMLAMYFMPTIIALARQHRNAAAIGALNLLLGWSVLGWIVAFVWSLTAAGPPAHTIVLPPTQPPVART